jgi:hypothetical protein
MVGGKGAKNMSFKAVFHTVGGTKIEIDLVNATPIDVEKNLCEMAIAGGVYTLMDGNIPALYLNAKAIAAVEFIEAPAKGS